MGAPARDLRRSRARDDRPRPVECVRLCISLMAAGEWKRGETAERLAAEWGLSPKTVEDYALQASRHLHVADEPEALRRGAVAELLRIAEESGNDRVPAIRAALEAAGLLKQHHTVELSAKVSEMPREKLFEEALTHPGFTEWLESRGWRKPELVETTGEGR